MLLSQLGQQDPDHHAALEGSIEALLAETSDAELQHFMDRLARTGEDWGYHPVNGLARALSRVVQSVIFEPGSSLGCDERLALAGGRRIVFLANHISFVDANAFEHLLATGGHEDIARRLVVVTGPKVYSRPLRRLASLCFGTIKVPQSSSRASGEAIMPPREVAGVARQVLREAAGRVVAGDALLVFVEGTRSRSGGMQRALAGVARYLADDGLLLVPAGIWGTERLVPIAETETLHPTRVAARIGRPIEADLLRERCGRNRSLMMDTVGLLIAQELPDSYRGVYGDESAGANDPALTRAREIAASL